MQHEDCGDLQNLLIYCICIYFFIFIDHTFCWSFSFLCLLLSLLPFSGRCFKYVR